MNFIVNGYNVFIIILTTFLTSLILTHLMIKISKNMNIMDIPNERSVHKKPTPLLGGIAIFLSFLFGFILFGNQNPLMISILIASFLILLLGIFDDIKPIKARYKFVIHILVALIVVFYGGLKLTHVDIFSLSLNFKWMSPYITILIIVGIINAVNLIDGLDGLCAGISSIYFLTIGVIALILNKFNGLDIILSFIMLGATLGFLVFNYPPAKIFMGDTGSTFLGLMISVIMLLGFKTVTLTSLLIPLVLLILPITDTLFAIIRRALNKKPIGQADKEHIHHQLLKHLSTRKTILVIYVVDLIFSVVSIFYAIGKKKEMIIFYILLMFILLYLVFKTNVIFKKKENKK
ncbi:undecaprenyl-phosphate N-acetylglucosaminyl 1-phosphate transferase [Clostridium sp. CAG:628]|nr:undecaprenyl-phosphate N-acetylglucosaminyl 1-phosphate transferase [Clostridium sp. CAG:628]